MSEYPMKKIFDILEMDARLGRLTTAEDLDPFSPSVRSRRSAELLKHADDPAVAAIYAQVPALSYLLGIDLHVDHVKPIAAGGSHTARNLQIVPAATNLEKSDKTLFKY
jgi:hypothetical protein